LRGGNVEDGECSPSQRLHRAELRKPRDPVALDRPLSRDPDLVPDAVVMALGRAGVDDDLPGTGGPVALDERYGIEARRRPVQAEREGWRAPGTAQRLAVAADQLGVVRATGEVDDLARGALHVGKATDLLEQGGRDRGISARRELDDLTTATTALVFSYEPEKISSNAFEIVSVRT
jgi:hypothetical protein